jgi:hypothetical protein
MLSVSPVKKGSSISRHALAILVVPFPTSLCPSQYSSCYPKTFMSVLCTFWCGTYCIFHPSLQGPVLLTVIFRFLLTVILLHCCYYNRSVFGIRVLVASTGFIESKLAPDDCFLSLLSWIHIRLIRVHEVVQRIRQNYGSSATPDFLKSYPITILLEKWALLKRSLWHNFWLISTNLPFVWLA